MRKSRIVLGVLMASGIAVYVNSMFGSEPLGGDKQQCALLRLRGCEVLLPRTDAALSKTVTVAGKIPNKAVPPVWSLYVTRMGALQIQLQ